MKIKNYPCLLTDGVACEIAIEEGLQLRREKDRDGLYSYGGLETHLPKSVRDWLGLSSSSGGFGSVVRASLDHENDHGKTFAEIADIIESEPLGLFVDPKP